MLLTTRCPACLNTRKGSGENRGEEATVILWTLWGKQADNAAQYLAKGSHVNMVGRVQNNNCQRDGETIYTIALTSEGIDHLDTKAEGEALRGKWGRPTEADAQIPMNAVRQPARAEFAGVGKSRRRQPPLRKPSSTSKAT